MKHHDRMDDRIGRRGLLQMGPAALIGSMLPREQTDRAAADSERRPVETRIGRPVRVVSLSFRDRPLAEIVARIDGEGALGTDLIALPETWRGQGSNTQETLDGPTIQAISALARKHNTYIVCPIDRTDGPHRRNSAVLVDRQGRVIMTYDKVYPYWSEFDLHPPVQAGHDVPVHQADFGRIGIAICFDVNFPDVWQRLADQGQS